MTEDLLPESGCGGALGHGCVADKEFEQIQQNPRSATGISYTIWGQFLENQIFLIPGNIEPRCDHSQDLVCDRPKIVP